MNLIEMIIEKAKGEIGNAETPLGSNQTKYGEAYGWNGVAWCVMFIWYLFHSLNLDELFPKTAHCDNVVSYAKERKRWITPEQGYKKGDLVIFNYDGDAENDHIELVINVGAGYVTTIGGNVKDKVCEQNRFLETAGIIGAYRPVYDVDEELDPIEDMTEEYCTATVPWLKLGAVGLQVELLQYALCRNGYLPENSRKKNGFFDGEFGYGTQNALERFQLDKDISPCELDTLGPETIQAMIGV